MIDRSRTYLLFLGVVAFAFAFKAPFAAGRVRLTPDAIAYLNVAHNLGAGDGLTSTLKLHYIGSAGVRHSALADWPPIYPLFAALLLRLGGSLITLQVANALLASLAAGIVFLIGTSLFGGRAGLLAGGAAALAPNLFRAGSVAMADVLGLTLALTAVMLGLRARESGAVWFVSGVLAGLAALTRYPNAVVGIALVAFALTSRETRRYTLGCLGGMACVLAPPWIVQCLTHGPSLGQMQALHYGVGSFHSALWDSRAGVDGWYAAHHAGPVVAAIGHNSAVYALDLLAGPRGLFLLSMGLLSAALGLTPVPLTRERKLVLTIAALNFAAHALTWSIPAVKGSRFLLLSYCLVLPFCANGLVALYGDRRRSMRLAAVGVCTATAGVYVWGCLTAAAYTAGECVPLSPALSRAITRSLPRGASIATNNPWVVSYSTGAPTALLPRDLDQGGLDRYVRHLGIGEIVLLGEHPRSRTARAVRTRYAMSEAGPKVALALTGASAQGQKAYDGILKMTPQMVQKLPTTHSASMTPRKNGSARL